MTTKAQADAYRDAACDRRSDHQDFTHFKSLIATPNTVGTFTLPARGWLAFSHSVNVAAGQITFTIGTHTIGVPAVLANVVHRLGFFERAKLVTINNVAMPAGSFKLYVLDHWRRGKVIATRTF